MDVWEEVEKAEGINPKTGVTEMQPVWEHGKVSTAVSCMLLPRVVSSVHQADTLSLLADVFSMYLQPLWLCTP